MTLQSGENFGLGAATAGEIGLNLFQKRPDPKRKTNSAKAQLRSKSNSFFKEKNSYSTGTRTDHATQAKLDEAIKKMGNQLQTQR